MFKLLVFAISMGLSTAAYSQCQRVSALGSVLWLTAIPTGYSAITLYHEQRRDRQKKEQERQRLVKQWRNGMVVNFDNKTDESYRFVIGEPECSDSLNLPKYKKKILNVCSDVIVKPGEVRPIYLKRPYGTRATWVVYWPANTRGKNPFNPLNYKTRAIVHPLSHLPSHNHTSHCYLRNPGEVMHTDGFPKDTQMMCKSMKMLTAKDYIPIEPASRDECYSVDCCEDPTFLEWRKWYDKKNGG